MDSPEQKHQLLGAFLAGDLDAAGARRWDEHLLECEQCWQAVRENRAGRQAAQLLRQPAPAGLADRVAFAVEVAAASRAATRRRARPGTRSPQRARHGSRSRRRAGRGTRSRRARPGRWLRWQGLAGAAAIAVGLAVTLAVLLLPGGGAAVPASVAAVARYAQSVPPPARDEHPGVAAAPVEVGRPVTVMAAGQRIVMRTWRLGVTEVVVAVSGQPFPMPDRARTVSGGGMAWAARLGRLGLYCLNGRRSELVAAPVPAAELAGLAARLPLA